MSDTQTEFTCKCGLQKAWIGQGITTAPCPSCGRIYKGLTKINRKRGYMEIHAIEMTNNIPITEDFWFENIPSVSKKLSLLDRIKNFFRGNEL